MKRRWLTRVLVFAILAAFAVWLEPTRVVWGWLRGEAFCQGRPTSYWRAELGRWEKTVGYGMGPTRFEIWTRDAHWLENWFLERTMPESEGPPQPMGANVGVDALAVLRELVNDESPRVRQVAVWRLEMLEAEDGAPHH
jgi:hypothetical protein